ncbi:MAG: NADH-quinone oxidoreductase subunit J [Chloroflexi bacterium]|nr:NADH-quinone oxidoreductase subunit J [Chloroflexota bacterium]MCL5110115.1 NADH-quinone oxidoreductase subunit J [Chloroflexota bacterium]
MSDPLVTLVFYGIAAVTIVAAIGVVSLRNIYRAALCLVLTFLGVAGVYILLNADFVAVMQVLIYAGAVTTMLLFAIMLTRSPGSPRSNAANRQSGLALFAVLVLVVLLVLALGTAVWPQTAPVAAQSSVDVLAKQLFTTYALPFEIASVLLLAAMVGAIILARED